MMRNTYFKSGTTVGRMENKGSLNSITSLNLLGITNLMCGINVANNAGLSLVAKNTIVPILSISSRCAAPNTCCVGSTISSSSCTSSCTKVVGTCKSCTSIVSLWIGGSILLSLVYEISELLVSFGDVSVWSWINFLKFSTCCSKRDHHVGVSVGRETK